MAPLLFPFRIFRENMICLEALILVVDALLCFQERRRLARGRSTRWPRTRRSEPFENLPSCRFQFFPPSFFGELKVSCEIGLVVLNHLASYVEDRILVKIPGTLFSDPTSRHRRTRLPVLSLSCSGRWETYPFVFETNFDLFGKSIWNFDLKSSVGESREQL